MNSKPDVEQNPERRQSGPFPGRFGTEAAEIVEETVPGCLHASPPGNRGKMQASERDFSSKRVIEDLLWALLNTPEFVLQGLSRCRS